MNFAAVFPGQGSQSLGMLQSLCDTYPMVREVFQEASDVLGFDLWSLASNGPQEMQDRTENTQPLMLSAGVAAWHVWRARGGCTPAAMAGHSLGEYTALVCSGAIAFADAVGLVAERGRLMQSAVPQGEGAMAALLGLDAEQVRAVCEQAAQDSIVTPVNFNSPGQVVIAGRAEAVTRALALASEAGAKRAVPLPVSVPSHCELMRPAAEALAERLNTITIESPGIPVYHNADVAAYQDVDNIREALARQLFSPVRWVETIGQFAAAGVTHVVEFGPGRVLMGLGKRTDRSLKFSCVQDVDSLDTTLTICEEDTE